jgi:hypothetical protein
LPTSCSFTPASRPITTTPNFPFSVAAQTGLDINRQRQGDELCSLPRFAELLDRAKRTENTGYFPGHAAEIKTTLTLLKNFFGKVPALDIYEVT